jgi:[CysO sulfur-carrier protein]-S-L-cysteine hydrolase
VPLTLPAAMRDQLIAHARRETPNECCGVIAGRADLPVRLIEAENAEHSPYRYSIGSRELLRIFRELDDNDLEMLVIYHSHTHTPAYPSPTDLSLAGYPDAFYLLISLEQTEPDVRAYRIVDGSVREEPIVVAAG